MAIKKLKFIMQNMKIPLDDYNTRIRKDGLCGTITANAPRYAFRHIDTKIIEVYECDVYENQESSV